MKILVVCAAGASSTFVALRLRRAAEAAGLDWSVTAATQDGTASASHDLVLLGPHLADRLDEIRGTTAAPVSVLPPDIFDDRDGVRTLGIVRSLLTDHRFTSEGRS